MSAILMYVKQAAFKIYKVLVQYNNNKASDQT